MDEARRALALLLGRLEDMARALAAGDLAAVAGMADAELARAVARVEAAGAALARDGEGLARLRRIAEANARRLAAAAEGVRAARTCLAGLRDGGPAAETYDGALRRQSLAAGAPRIERRL